MKFDPATLIFAGSIAAAVSGLVPLSVWLQLRSARALLWWSAASIAYAAGIAMLAIDVSSGSEHLAVIGTVAGDASAPLIWIGTVMFNRRRPPPVPAFLAIGVWLAIDAAAMAVLDVPLVGFIGWIVFLSLSTMELWHGRAERILARWLLAGLFMIHAAVYLAGIVGILTGNAITPLDSAFRVILFEGILYLMASAVLVSLLCKERETLDYKRAARSDSLTGIANHGALLESARRIYERCRKDGVPFSLIMFDLDHFKTVNDRFGHRTGDDILRAFVDTVRGLLRPTDLFGRYGGEEFTVILPGAAIETAHVIAERVRHAFAEQSRFLDGRPLNATVSAGVAEADACNTFDDVLDAADRAMYRAKDLGRNRIERAERTRPTDGRDNVIRVA